MSIDLDFDIAPINPKASGIHINCDSLTFNIHGIELKANLPSLEHVEELVINGIKFVRYKE